MSLKEVVERVKADPGYVDLTTLFDIDAPVPLERSLIIPTMKDIMVIAGNAPQKAGGVSDTFMKSLPSEVVVPSYREMTADSAASGEILKSVEERLADFTDWEKGLSIPDLSKPVPHVDRKDSPQGGNSNDARRMEGVAGDMDVEIQAKTIKNTSLEDFAHGQVRLTGDLADYFKHGVVQGKATQYGRVQALQFFPKTWEQKMVDPVLIVTPDPFLNKIFFSAAFSGVAVMGAEYESEILNGDFDAQTGMPMMRVKSSWQQDRGGHRLSKGEVNNIMKSVTGLVLAGADLSVVRAPMSALNLGEIAFICESAKSFLQGPPSRIRLRMRH